MSFLKYGRKTKRGKGALFDAYLFQEDVEIPLVDQIIQGVVFRPYKSALLPGTIHVAGTSNKDIVRINACCLYKKCDGEK